VIFDLDGVVTDTATVHATAWKALFDEFLSARPAATGEDHRPFTDDDYLRFVDGRARRDGVASFLSARGIELPEGRPDDDDGALTVHGLGNAKNRHFLDALAARGVPVFDTTVELVRQLRDREVRIAVVSASENCAAVLDAGGVAALFDERVDGMDALALALPGKPDPALFLEAANRLAVAPGQAAVVEDAIAGVQAGRAGGFGVVIGVDRTGPGDALRRSGADVVVTDLGEVEIDAGA
jgi:alpha,alpha-trehalase